MSKMDRLANTIDQIRAFRLCGPSPYLIGCEICAAIAALAAIHGRWVVMPSNGAIGAVEVVR